MGAKKAKPADPLTLDCPHCHVPAGSPCRAPNGRNIGKSHAARKGVRGPTAPPSGRISYLNLDPDITDRIMDRIAMGTPIDLAVAAAGIHRGTFFRWMERGERESNDPEDAPYQRFRDAILRARGEGGSWAVETIVKVANGGYVERTIEHRDPATGAVVATETIMAKPDWKAAAWIGERSYARHFSRRTVLEVGASDGLNPVSAEQTIAESEFVDESAMAAVTARLRARHAERLAIGAGDDGIEDAVIVE